MTFPEQPDFASPAPLSAWWLTRETSTHGSTIPVEFLCASQGATIVRALAEEIGFRLREVAWTREFAYKLAEVIEDRRQGALNGLRKAKISPANRALIANQGIAFAREMAEISQGWIERERARRRAGEQSPAPTPGQPNTGTGRTPPPAGAGITTATAGPPGTMHDSAAQVSDQMWQAGARALPIIMAVYEELSTLMGSEKAEWATKWSMIPPTTAHRLRYEADLGIVSEETLRWALWVAFHAPREPSFFVAQPQQTLAWYEVLVGVRPSDARATASAPASAAPIVPVTPWPFARPLAAPPPFVADRWLSWSPLVQAAPSLPSTAGASLFSSSAELEALPQGAASALSSSVRVSEDVLRAEVSRAPSRAGAIGSALALTLVGAAMAVGYRRRGRR